MPETEPCRNRPAVWAIRGGSESLSRANPAFQAAAWITAMVVTLSPLLWVRVPPLVDYPNHLARAWILVHGSQLPALAASYSVHWRILPDLAMDLVVSALAHVMPVEQAGRVFVALTMALLVGGTLSLHRAIHGRAGIWPLCSVLFVYNAVLFWGFVSCLFAIGAYLFVFGGWIATRSWRNALRLPVFAVAAALLLLLHLFAFGLYALSVASYELGLRLHRRRLSWRVLIGWAAATSLPLLPGVVLWRLSLADAGSTLTVYGGLAAKLYALIAPLDFGVNPAPFDRLLAIAACLGLAAGALTRTIRLPPEMRLPLAAMALAAVLMPNRISGGWSADLRLPVTLPFVVIASTNLEIPRRAAAGMVMFVMAALMAGRVWAVSQSWRDYGRWFDEFRIASMVITPGARLLVAEATPGEVRALSGVPPFFARPQPVVFTHMAALAVIDRAAFFPYMFTGWTTLEVTARNLPASQREGRPARLAELVQSLRRDPATAPAVVRVNAIGERPYWRDWAHAFDFALVMDFGSPKQVLPKEMQILTTGSFFDICRIVNPRRAASVPATGGAHGPPPAGAAQRALPIERARAAR